MLMLLVLKQYEMKKIIQPQDDISEKCYRTKTLGNRSNDNAKELNFDSKKSTKLHLRIRVAVAGFVGPGIVGKSFAVQVRVTEAETLVLLNEKPLS